MASGALIAIVGPTASGKTALAIELAKAYNGEVVCADSRTVYKGMDISTAKPSKQEQAGISHHLLDVVEPNQPFNAADFKHLALQAIDDISSRGRIPIITGGSGLFIDSVLYDYSFEEGPDLELRRQLEDKTVQELQDVIIHKNIPMPENKKNPRYLIRAIERKGRIGSKKPLRKETLLLGLNVPKEDLRQRLHQRLEHMINNGLLDEINQLTEVHGWDMPAFQTPAMKAFKKYIQKEATLAEAKELFIRGDLQLAKRQITWFKRNPDIIWVQNNEEALQLTDQFVSKYLLQ